MTLVAGIDEAGYGPQLGPLVVAGTAFRIEVAPAAGVLWDVLAEATVLIAGWTCGRRDLLSCLPLPVRRLRGALSGTWRC